MSIALPFCTFPPDPIERIGFDWEELAPIPDSIGYAGSFAGTCKTGILMAGGANFPNGGTPWNGGAKVWYDTIYFYDPAIDNWLVAGKLPQPAGYGVTVSLPEGLLLIGGSNQDGHLASVLLVNYENKQLSFKAFPSLPVPLANSSGALVGNTVYVAGGLISPDSSSASKLFLSLNLNNPAAGWKEESSWPGPSRMLAVASSDGSSFFLFSGTTLIDGKRQYLNDAYVFSPVTGWNPLPDLPHPVVAAPSPAPFIKEQGFFIFGGDDGALAAQAATLKANHPGFSQEVLNFQPADNSWLVAGSMPVQPPVTTSLVFWKETIVLPGGEIRPGFRTNKVLRATPIR